MNIDSEKLKAIIDAEYARHQKMIDHPGRDPQNALCAVHEQGGLMFAKRAIEKLEEGCQHIFEMVCECHGTPLCSSPSPETTMWRAKCKLCGDYPSDI